ncbi:MAG: hypothetical protein ACRD0K_20965 [Egibacteraceae bacterium]
MMQLTPARAGALRDRFLPDRPGPLVGPHVIQTGNGSGFADRWPDPRAVLMDSAGNYSLSGDPDALQPDDLARRVVGFLEAPETFTPLLQATFPHLRI